MMNSIHDFYDMMEKGNIMLSFKGEVTSDLLTSILQIMETKMETLDEPPKIKKKVYNILVECLQNLYHHIDEDDKETAQNEKSALFMIRKNDDGEYSIMTGNYMAVENMDLMKTRLDKINSMDKEELKVYYKEVLNNGEMSAKGGGGLGMIDIARKSGKKLEYDFADVDDKFSFFSLNVKIAQ